MTIPADQLTDQQLLAQILASTRAIFAKRTDLFFLDDVKDSDSSVIMPNVFLIDDEKNPFVAHIRQNTPCGSGEISLTISSKESPEADWANLKDFEIANRRNNQCVVRDWIRKKEVYLPRNLLEIIYVGMVNADAEEWFRYLDELVIKKNNKEKIQQIFSSYVLLGLVGGPLVDWFQSRGDLFCSLPVGMRRQMRQMKSYIDRLPTINPKDSQGVSP